MDIDDEKKIIRKAVKLKKQALTSEDRKNEAHNVFKELESLQNFKEAKTILLYHSLPDELETSCFIEKWYKKKKLLLPVVNGYDMILREYEGKDSLSKGSFGIYEPTGKQFTEYGKIDLAIVPGIAFTLSGKRLGRGGGFYDRFFSNSNCTGIYKIGICFKCQITHSLPTTDLDVMMNKIIFG